MFGLSMNELLLILIIVLVLFGATKVPQLLKGIGTGMKEFKKAIKDDEALPGQTAATPEPEEKKHEN